MADKEPLSDPVGVRFPKTVLAKIQELADKERRNISEMVRLIVADALEERKP